MLPYWPRPPRLQNTCPENDFQEREDHGTTLALFYSIYLDPSAFDYRAEKLKGVKMLTGPSLALVGKLNK